MSSVKLAAPCASHASRLAYRYVGSSTNVVASSASTVAPPPAAPPPATPPPPAPPPAVLPTTTHAIGASQSCLATLRRVPSSAISGLPEAARWLLTWFGLGLGVGVRVGLGLANPYPRQVEAAQWLLTARSMSEQVASCSCGSTWMVT